MSKNKGIFNLFMIFWVALFAVITSPWLILISVIWLFCLGKFLLPALFVIFMITSAFSSKIILIPIGFIDNLIQEKFNFSKTQVYFWISSTLSFLIPMIILVSFSLYMFHNFIGLSRSSEYYFPVLIFIYLISFMPTLALATHTFKNNEIMNLFATIAVLNSLICALGIAVFNFNFDSLITSHLISSLLGIILTLLNFYFRNRDNKLKF